MIRAFRPSQTAAPSLLLALALEIFFSPLAQAQSDPLPSWNDGQAKRAIIAFVKRVTKDGGPDFVPTSERIAVFDNDGTLWVEKPLPNELYFVLSRANS